MLSFFERGILDGYARAVVGSQILPMTEHYQEDLRRHNGYVHVENPRVLSLKCCFRCYWSIIIAVYLLLILHVVSRC